MLPVQLEGKELTIQGFLFVLSSELKCVIKFTDFSPSERVLCRGDLLLRLETCLLHLLSNTAGAASYRIWWDVPHLKGPCGMDPGERAIYFL